MSSDNDADYGFRQDWLDEVHVNDYAVILSARKYEKGLNKAWKKLESLLLLKAVTVVDLTTLAGDDTYSNVSALINKALHPLPVDFLRRILDSITSLLDKINSTSLKEKRNVKIEFDKIDDFEYASRITGNIEEKHVEFKDLTFDEFLNLKELVNILGFNRTDSTDTLNAFLSLKDSITGFQKNSDKVVRTAAVCIYPAFVEEVKNILVARGLNTNSNDSTEIDSTDRFSIAAVAAGFPAGLYDITSKIQEIKFAIHSGATEIDIVISRYLVLGHRWLELFNEIRSLKLACGKRHMKTILSVGECGSLENVYKASMVAMMAGSDYIKTSTGKESVNATFPTGLVMCRAINNFYAKTGKKIGFKPAGGIRTAEDSLKWIRLVISELSAEWLPFFRMGASGVLGDIIKRLQELNSMRNCKMKQKNVRKLVEDHFTQKDMYDEDDELEEDSLVKSTLNDVLNGNLENLRHKSVDLDETLSSKTYAGKTVSRKSYENDDSDFNSIDESFSDGSEIASTEGDVTKGETDPEKKEISTSSEADDSEEDEDDTEQSDVDTNDDSKIDAEEENMGEHYSESGSQDDSEIEDDLSEESDTKNNTSILYSKGIRDESSEIKKGNAVRNQLALWEILLECRITLQQCLAASNRLPKPEKYETFWAKLSRENKNSVIESREKVWDLLEKLIYFQNKLRQQCPEFLETANKRKTNEEDNKIDPETQKTKRRKLSEYPEVLQKLFDDYTPFRNSTIQKWNDRTKIASGKYAKSNFLAFDQPVLKQIDQIMSDKDRLMQRTFIKRSHYRIIGEDGENEKDEENVNNKGEIVEEIYDDDDFYQKLLRDYIAQKTSDISDPTQLGRKLVHLQKLRTKIKRPIDTRRTKGRKIKFDVYPKLVNFMVPVTVDRWENTAIDELYSSVFGKNLLT